ncbi:hypothetical protein A3Q56_03991 [Intoshia linei]|uniref:SH2 domain-containing protein n=1 Tax=Intoshia linei TaxID=1819745 RepID=A0A177B3S0_9BILA|nr:hypothetical protein A3Q56_03991 [Intoshia linei]
MQNIKIFDNLEENCRGLRMIIHYCFVKYVHGTGKRCMNLVDFHVNEKSDNVNILNCIIKFINYNTESGYNVLDSNVLKHLTKADIIKEYDLNQFYILLIALYIELHEMYTHYQNRLKFTIHTKCPFKNNFLDIVQRVYHAIIKILSVETCNNSKIYFSASKIQEFYDYLANKNCTTNLKRQILRYYFDVPIQNKIFNNLAITKCSNFKSSIFNKFLISQVCEIQLLFHKLYNMNAFVESQIMQINPNDKLLMKSKLNNVKFHKHEICLNQDSGNASLCSIKSKTSEYTSKSKYTEHSNAKSNSVNFVAKSENDAVYLKQRFMVEKNNGTKRIFSRFKKNVFYFIQKSNYFIMSNYLFSKNKYLPQMTNIKYRCIVSESDSFNERSTVQTDFHAFVNVILVFYNNPIGAIFEIQPSNIINSTSKLFMMHNVSKIYALETKSNGYCILIEEINSALNHILAFNDRKKQAYWYKIFQHYYKLYQYESNVGFPHVPHKLKKIVPTLNMLMNEKSKIYQNLYKKPWYHFNLSRSRAAKFVTNKNKSKEGLYLVRESETRIGDFVISFNTNNRTRHLRIELIDKERLRIHNLTFDTMTRLIEYFHRHPLPTESIGLQDNDVILTDYVVNWPSISVLPLSVLLALK